MANPIHSLQTYQLGECDSCVFYNFGSTPSSTDCAESAVLTNTCGLVASVANRPDGYLVGQLPNCLFKTVQCSTATSHVCLPCSAGFALSALSLS